MNYLHAILMGFVQGLSEFLPISSSAHLVFTSNFYKIMNGIDISKVSSYDVFFDIMLHLGTLIAVIIYFRKEICSIAKELFVAIKNRDYSNPEAKCGLYIILGTIITIIVGFTFNDAAEDLVYSPMRVGILLIITGFILFYSEYKSKRIKNRQELDLKSAIMISLAQGIAVLPGFSRSGWTIAAGLFNGLDRITAARYSFLLSIPIILGASMFYPLISIDYSEIVSYNWSEIIVGTVVSAIVGYLCIKYFLKLISKFSLAIFGYYCVIVGILTTIFFALNA